MTPEDLKLARPSPGLQAAAVLLAVLGSCAIKPKPWLALLLYVAAGSCLAWAQRGRTPALPLEERPRARRQAWEPWFFLALMGLGLLSFGWHLGSIPEGANYSEGELAVRAGVVDRLSGYLAHDTGEICWPTLYHYEGILFAKHMDYTAGSFRLPSVIWAMVVLAAFYFTARMLTSPETAAILSLLWLSFHFNIHFARRYSPVIFLYLPPFLSLSLTLAGLRSQRWWRSLWFLGAGLALGVCMHGYFPGRVVPGAFVVLSIALWARRRATGIKLLHLLMLWVGFTVMAWPIIRFAISKPAVYNEYLNRWSLLSTDRFKDKQGLAPYAQVFVEQIKPYLLMFHVAGNSEYEEDDSYGRPVLDPVMGVLFPLGFFFSLYFLWQGVPLYLMALFWLGLLPGLYTRLGLAPFPRREIAAFPAVFLFAGLALEQLRLGFSRVPRRVWMSVGLLVGLLLLGREWNHYWDYTHSPGFRRFTDATAFHAGEEMRAHRQDRIVISECLQQDSPCYPLLMPPTVPLISLRRAEEFLYLDPDRDNLLLMSGYLGPLLPVFKDAYPGAEVKQWREPAYDDPAYFMKQWTGTIFQAFAPDVVNPSLLLTSMRVPKEEARKRFGALDMEGGGLMQVTAADFCQNHAGRPLHLGATVLVDTVGQTLTVRLPWSGWRLRVDGEPQPMNKPFACEGGLRFVELQGRIPSGAQGALGLQVDSRYGVQPGLKQLLAWRFEHGLRAEYLPGMSRQVDRKALYSSIWRLPLVRFNEDYKLVNYPAQVRLTGRFTPPSSGVWEFRLAWPGGGDGRIMVAGKPVFARSELFAVAPASLTLTAGRAVPFRVDYEMQLNAVRSTAMALQARGPGHKDFQWMDPRWFTLPAAGQGHPQE